MDGVTTEEPLSTVTSSTEQSTPTGEPIMTTNPEPETTMTSTKPSPTTAPVSPRHYVVKSGNTVCLVMDATITFTIPYYKTDNTVSI